MKKKTQSDLILFPLSPKHNVEDVQPYKEVWEKAKSNCDIRNIAFTGDFGIGKSSILRSFKSKEFRFISVYGFLGEGTNSNWEYDLLTQLLLCGRTDSCPALVPQKAHHFRTFFLILCAALISLCSFVLLYMDKILKSISLLPQNKSPIIQYLEKILKINIPFTGTKNTTGLGHFFRSATTWIDKNNAWISLGAIVILGLCIISITVTVVFLLSTRKLKSKEINLEIDGLKTSLEEGISCLDIYRPKLIEVLAKCKKTLVFEDMDRLNPDQYMPLLSQLHNLNRDANAWCTKKKPIRFVYVINDDIFCKENEQSGNDSLALKFFDFIIPAVPSLSKLNAEVYLTNEMEKVGFTNHEFISVIAPYLCDYRIVNNILNEYQIMRLP